MELVVEDDFLVEFINIPLMTKTPQFTNHAS